MVTSYRVMINSTDDAVHDLATHDALHYGYVLSFRKITANGRFFYFLIFT